ncbi:DEAD/DEAH box helicase [Xylanibacter brevis]|uniref:DEAD/DEAH box helicase n=1 Tax=Xylanibacter brevis TaxID=83231 RepID=UPI0005C496BB|nr:DEAD/DEAH box helicase [Xylanibacter brevis]
MTFEETYLNDNILDALYDMHFDEMTPIQEKCIPEILDGHDVLGVAQTGTGKTAAYLLPILSMLDDGGFPDDAINCIIMSPTRELAQQIDQAMEGFSYYLDNVSSIAVYGGNDGSRFDQEIKSLRGGAPVVIATPGRLLSHLKVGNLDLSKTSFFVLDEADRMLDMGFSEDILQINKLLPDTCQKVMFSATMPSKIRELAVSLLKDPVEVKLKVSKPAEKIQQSAYVCYDPQKVKIIEHLFKQGEFKRVIIFCGKKDRVKEINRTLQKMKINCAPMHSDLTQAERDEVMYQFKAGQIDVLVATDIVSRGIDIDDIQTVINFDVPNDAEDYVHRIGRTARADRDGVAITFVNEKDMKQFQQIEKFLEKVVDKNTLPEGLGEGPEYKIIEKKKHSGRNGKPHKRNTKGTGKGTHKGASKGQNKGQHKQKGKSEEK